jgi:hypothetical protein
MNVAEFRFRNNRFVKESDLQKNVRFLELGCD